MILIITIMNIINNDGNNTNDNDNDDYNTNNNGPRGTEIFLMGVGCTRKALNQILKRPLRRAPKRAPKRHSKGSQIWRCLSDL